MPGLDLGHLLKETPHALRGGYRMQTQSTATSCIWGLAGTVQRAAKGVTRLMGWIPRKHLFSK